MRKGVVASAAVWCIVFVVVAQVHETAAAAVSCDPSELSPCVPSITEGGSPTTECCSKLKEQQPCFCKYFRIPRPTAPIIIKNPNAKKIAAICGVTIPTYCPLNI